MDAFLTAGIGDLPAVGAFGQLDLAALADSLVLIERTIAIGTGTLFLVLVRPGRRFGRTAFLLGPEILDGRVEGVRAQVGAMELVLGQSAQLLGDRQRVVVRLFLLLVVL
jgi:hypothetical protein